MKPIGTKSITTASLFLLSFGITLSEGHFAGESIANLSPAAAFSIGTFAVLVGTWFYRFWRLNSTSRSYIRISNGPRWEGEQVVLEFKGYALLAGWVERKAPEEFSHGILRTLSLGICLCIALLCFNKHTVDLMLDTPRKLIGAGTQFCPPEVPEKEKPVPKMKPGCELMYRAYSLGYVKSLGSCTPDEEEEKLELCTLRQVDEPYLHYTVRLFFSHFDHVVKKFSGPDVTEKARKRLAKQLQHFDALIGKERNVVMSTPKASHHIFTNLPSPHGALAEVWRKWFQPNDCMLRFKNMPHTLKTDAKEYTGTSRALEHAYGQMLFHSKYDEGVGNCNEYKIHWRAPVDSCDQLAKNPEAFLRSQGIAEEVQTVLTRLKKRDEYKKLESDLARIAGSAQPIGTPMKPERNESGELKPRVLPAPQTIISFQCFVRQEKDGQTENKIHPVKVFGQNFTVTETRFPLQGEASRKIRVDVLKNLGATLSEGFHYTGYLSHQSANTANQWQTGPEAFDGENYVFTHLENLKSTDIFLGNDWLQDREDLLEVYPYYYHLYHFVQLFRQSYRMQRTHL